MLIKLVVGDWSCDGHNQTEDVLIECNAENVDKLKEAFRRGAKIVGLELGRNNTYLPFCNEYENDTIDITSARLLQRAGISIEIDQSFEDVVEYAEVWCRVAQIGDPILLWRIYEPSNINIGGYGLFYD